MKAKIAVFVSGGGTNLQALIDAEKRGEHNAEGSGEAQLQTDRVDGKGIAQQNHHQRRAE